MNNQLTVKDVAKKLNISIDTVRRWAKLGLIRCVRDKYNNRLFDCEDVQLALLQHSTPASSGGSNYFVLQAQPTLAKTLELFAGCGGTALGLENAGFQNVMLSEINGDACATLRHNRPHWVVREGDVRKISFEEYAGQIHLLQGGVPCQAFSYAGFSRGFEDTRGTLFFEFARAISECKPDAIMMENVRGLLTHDGGKTICTMAKTLMELGYVIAIKLLRAQFLDVAQKRERVVVIGFRKDIRCPILFPRQNHKILTLRDAISNCPESECAKYPASKARIMNLIPPGGYWKDLPIELQKEYLKGSFNLPGGKTGMARRLSWDEPSLTLTCSPAQKQTERCHPSETRPLSIREYARIQSFPDEWEFKGSVGSKYKQIGNAVPVNFAYHVGRAILASLGFATEKDVTEVTPIVKIPFDSEQILCEALKLT